MLFILYYTFSWTFILIIHKSTLNLNYNNYIHVLIYKQKHSNYKGTEFLLLECFELEKTEKEKLSSTLLL